MQPLHRASRDGVFAKQVPECVVQLNEAERIAKLLRSLRLYPSRRQQERIGHLPERGSGGERRNFEERRTSEYASENIGKRATGNRIRSSRVDNARHVIA